MPLRVGIIGCGTAGQASAILLSRAGHRVTILERAEHMGPVGAGLLIQPTGMDVLSRLGVLSAMLELGTPIHYLRGVTRGGRVILDLAYEDLRAGLFGLGVHRGALFTILQQAVVESGAAIVCGAECTSMAQRDDGRVVIDRAGREHGPFDLIIVADGARSSLRAGVGAVRRARQYPWGALWLVAPDPRGHYQNTLAQVYDGTSRMIGFLPSGSTPGGGRTVSMFWSVRCDQVETIRRAGLETWKQDVRSLTDTADPILDHISSIDQLIFASYQDVVMQPWHEGSTVFLGDAGHAMSPQLGQGANLALVDALVLAECLAASNSIGDALTQYSAKRRAHLRFYQFASRWLTPVFQSGHEWVSGPRDLLMGPLGRIGWVRREMLRSLAGVKTGLFASFDLPRPMVQ